MTIIFNEASGSRNFPRPLRAAKTTLACLLPLALLTAAAADWPQWRGPQRNGLSAEKGFLKEWPKAGANLVWEVSDIGRGYSPPAVIADRLYVLGNEGNENEFVEALSAK